MEGLTQTNRIDRRKALALVAAAPAAVAIGPVPTFASDEPGELAALVQRYFAEVEAFNLQPDVDDKTSNALAAATYEKDSSEDGWRASKKRRGRSRSH